MKAALYILLAAAVLAAGFIAWAFSTFCGGGHNPIC